MALVQTTLTAPLNVNDLIIQVANATGFATSAVSPQFVRIDNEYSIIHPSYVSGVSVPIYRRGDQGTSVVSHNTGATVVTGLFSDMAALQAGAVAPIALPTEIEDFVTYSASGPVAIPTKNTTVRIAKTGTLAAMTLPAPGLDQDGLLVTFYILTALAHTITCPSALFQSGVSGSPHTIWTATTGFKGQGLTVQADAGSWIVLANNGGTFS